MTKQHCLTKRFFETKFINTNVLWCRNARNCFQPAQFKFKEDGENENYICSECRRDFKDDGAEDEEFVPLNEEERERLLDIQRMSAIHIYEKLDEYLLIIHKPRIPTGGKN